MAQVSTATVSRVINNKHQGNMSRETYEKVRRLLQQTNYVPHAIASGLRTGLTKVIGIVVPDNVNPYYAQLGHAIENACFQSGYTALICNTNRDIARERKYVRLLASQRVAGIILCSTGLNHEEIENNIARELTRVVLVDESVEGFGGPLVIGDDRRGGWLGMEYLSSLGHERVLILTGPANLSSTRDRLAGALGCAAGRGKSLPPELILNAGYALEAACEAVDSALERGGPPFSAVFAFNDLMAIGAMKALDRRGLKVPGEVSVLGYDNIFLNEIITPPLTTVATPIVELGWQSFQLILGRQQAPPDRRPILVQPRLVVRESCARLPESSRLDRDGQAAVQR